MSADLTERQTALLAAMVPQVMHLRPTLTHTEATAFAHGLLVGYGHGSPGAGRGMLLAEPGEDGGALDLVNETLCPCFACTKHRAEVDPAIRLAQEADPIGANPLARMFLCTTCGNKRCPRAADHRHTCTGSNEPGQKGSLYE